jgi:hypothetical protein
MLPDLGNTVYDIRDGEQNWPAVGGNVTHKPRMGFLPQNEPKEWLSIALHVSSSSNPADIPTEGLSLYHGETCIGAEGAWYLVRCKPAGAISFVELRTKPPSH